MVHVHITRTFGLQVTCLGGLQNSSRFSTCTAKSGNRSSCGNMTIDQVAGKGSLESKLTIQVMDAKEKPDIVLTRVDSSELVDVSSGSEGGAWSGSHRMKTGAWRIEYRSGPVGHQEVCGKSHDLRPVKCASDHEDKQGECVTKKQTTCGDLVMTQGPGVGSAQSNLTIMVENATARPKVQLSRANTTELLALWQTPEQVVWSGGQEVGTGMFQIEYFSGNELCAQKKLTPIECDQPGFEEKGGMCQAKKASTCGRIENITQGSGTGSANSNLTIMVKGDTNLPQITLSPVVTRTNISLDQTGPQRWENIQQFALPTGSWEVEYKSGEEVCKSHLPLEKVRCLANFENVDGGCAKKGTTCGKMKLSQSAGIGSNASNLTIMVEDTGEAPKITLSPVVSPIQINLDKRTGGEEWAQEFTLPAGTWEVEYKSGQEVCTFSRGESRLPLQQVQCLVKEGYGKDQSGICVRQNKTREETVCDSASVVFDGKPISRSSAYKGTKLGIRVKDQYAGCKFEVVPLVQAKTRTLDQDLTMVLPGKHQVSVVQCPAQDDCILDKIEIKCPEGETDAGGICTKTCTGNQVITPPCHMPSYNDLALL